MLGFIKWSKFLTSQTRGVTPLRPVHSIPRVKVSMRILVNNKKRIFKLNLALFFYKNTESYYVAMTDLKLTMLIS